VGSIKKADKRCAKVYVTITRIGGPQSVFLNEKTTTAGKTIPNLAARQWKRMILERRPFPCIDLLCPRSAANVAPIPIRQNGVHKKTRTVAQETKKD
jgi:hypothetical protein